jgi:hypothetical protein
MPSQKEFEESFREHLATLKTEEALGELKRVDAQLQDPALLRAVDKQLSDLKTEEIISSIRATRRKAHCSALHEKAKERESLKVAELRKLVKEVRKERDDARQIAFNLSEAISAGDLFKVKEAQDQVQLARGIGGYQWQQSSVESEAEYRAIEERLDQIMERL